MNSQMNTNTYASRKFSLPPMNYNLMPVNSTAALCHIRCLCSGGGDGDGVVPSSISPTLCGFILSLNDKLLQRHANGKPSIFGYLPAPASIAITKQVIGDDEYYFKRTTAECDVDFIWLDRKNNMILFWAKNNFSISKAMNAIRWRINKISTLAEDEAEAKAYAYVFQPPPSMMAPSEAAPACEDISDDDEMPPLMNHDGTIYVENAEELMKRLDSQSISYLTCPGGGVYLRDEESSCRRTLSMGSFPDYEAPGLPE